mgnify:CR=1 FL=1
MLPEPNTRVLSYDMHVQVGVSFVALLASPLQPPAAYVLVKPDPFDYSVCGLSDAPSVVGRRRAVLGQDNDMRQLLLREDEGLDGGMV